MLTKRCSFIKTVFFLALAACAFITSVGAQTLAVDHASGQTDVPKNPQKVVVFDLGVIDNMVRLGLDDRLVGIAESPLPDYLESLSEKKYARVGSLFEPDYEAVAALSPDLIIVAGRSQAKFADLAQIAPTIDLSVNYAHYMKDVTRNVTILGKIFGVEELADTEMAALDAKIEAVKQVASTKGAGLLVLTTGGKMSAFGPGSRFGLLHEGFGVVAAVPDLSIGNHGQPISVEFILETNPDWLFVIDRDAAIGREGGARQLLDNVLVNKTTAAQQGQIVYLKPQNWYLVGGGIGALHQTADQLLAAFSASH